MNQAAMQIPGTEKQQMKTNQTLGLITTKIFTHIEKRKTQK